ncbi:hypothetical protein P8452_45540 [Trifolium repens]|nr:hypothetical protein P8452_45540 [Trifolium repens]
MRDAWINDSLIPSIRGEAIPNLTRKPKLLVNYTYYVCAIASGNEKSCDWHSWDFADGELKDEILCIRFPSIEIAKWAVKKKKEKLLDPPLLEKVASLSLT